MFPRHPANVIDRAVNRLTVAKNVFAMFSNRNGNDIVTWKWLLIHTLLHFDNFALKMFRKCVQESVHTYGFHNFCD